MTRKTILLILLSIFLLSSSGCLYNKDISELNIVSGLAIDKTEDGNIMVSVQLLIPSAFKSMGKEGAGGKKTFTVFSNTGNTVYAALNGLLVKLNKRTYLSSAQIIIIGEDASKSGINDIMDYLLREDELNYKTDVVVAKGMTAKDVLERKYDLTYTSALYVKDTLKNSENHALTKDMSLLEVAKELYSPGKSLTIGTIEKSDGKTSTEGMAAFLKYKMIGWFDGKETRGYMFMQGLLKNAVIEVENPLDPQKKIVVEVSKASRKSKVEWSADGRPTFSRDFKIIGNIGEQQNGHEIKEDKFMQMVAEKCNEEIKKEINKVIKKAQKEFKSDIFGFGYSVYGRKPDYWELNKDRWNSDIFPDVEVKINVDTELHRTGVIEKSFRLQ